jgi:hypothetical protein
MKKDKKKTDKIIMCIIGALIFISSYPVQAEYELGKFWSRNDDTIVLTNTSNNVSIGYNGSTPNGEKLYVNGSNVLFSDNLTIGYYLKY